MSPDDFRRLVSAGLSTDQIAIVMEMFAERDEARKASQRARWRKHQENKKNANVSKRELTIANVPRGGDARVEDKTSNLGIEPQKEERKETRERASFDSFWAAYPHRVGKADAVKAFDRALRRTDIDTLMAGLHRYVAKTDDRPWCNPATWLNQDRWTDEPASVAPVARGSPPRKAPQLADVFAFVARNSHERPTQENDGPRKALPDLSRAGQG